MAMDLNTNQNTISRYETGEREPGINELIKIADYFDTSVDYVIGHTDVKRRIEAVESYDLNLEEGKLIESFRKLGSRQKESIIMLLENYNEK